MIKIGCCGFSTAMKSYFGKFGLVEVQKTFYKLPRVETARKWREAAPPDFEFTVKAWQVITHPPSSPTYRKAGITVLDGGFFKHTDEVFDAWKRTEEIAAELGSRIILFQTPASFEENKENVENMSNFFSSIGSGFIFVWEPRGWKEEAVKDICEKLELVHCTDPFVAKPTHGRITYLRLHGSHARMYKHRYSDGELEWLRDYCEGIEKDVYVLFSNVYMYGDVSRFIQLLHQSDE